MEEEKEKSKIIREDVSDIEYQSGHDSTRKT